MWTSNIYYATEARALPNAVNGSVPCKATTPPSQRWLFLRPGAERRFHVRVPVLSMTRASVASCLLTYELLNSWEVTYEPTRQRATLDRRRLQA
jgi:hypothetical protein